MAKKKRKWTRNQKESAVLITLGVSVLICGACFLSPLKDAVKFGSKAIVKDLPIDDIKTAYKRMMKTKMNCTKKFEKSTQRKKLETNPAKFPAVQTNFL